MSVPLGVLAYPAAGAHPVFKDPFAKKTRLLHVRQPEELRERRRHGSAPFLALPPPAKTASSNNSTYIPSPKLAHRSDSLPTTPQSASAPPRPKHSPIVIPEYISLAGPSHSLIPTASGTPTPPRTPTGDLLPSNYLQLPEFPLPGSGLPSGGPSPAIQQTAGLGSTSNSTNGLSGLVCNVYRTTGREPRPLVGATTTVLGDKLYVFGGRRLSRTKPQMTSDLYELDLVHRHWTKIDARGDIPPPRYFHSVCALGDTKLVCYGGMSPSVLPSGKPTIPGQEVNPQDPQPEVVVMFDIHIFDIPNLTWMKIPTSDSPQGRYAHCAAILPSSSIFASANAPLSAIHHNPSSSNPNQGQLGVQLDGNGGAEMIVVGGQDSANHYIEQISVFNLRSLRWTDTSSLGRSCGAYRSVIAPIPSGLASQIGTLSEDEATPQADSMQHESTPGSGSAMLVYSNYNFLDVKLELQVRMADGTLTEKPMRGIISPPGLRFPNGGVIDNHFVVSGTFLTSSKQEYALWALNLKSLTWSRIDAGAGIFGQGSWNRGVLWSRRNTFVILGNRKRSLVEDYNHRRINFSNLCMVELEAFGLYDNPRKTAPNSGYMSISSPPLPLKANLTAGGRLLSKAAEDLGQMAFNVGELADMDFLAIGGERIPVNSRLVARRWGPYFNQLFRESQNGSDSADAATLRPSNIAHPSRNSSITITPSIKTTYSAATTLVANDSASTSGASEAASAFNPPEAHAPNPLNRPRTFYLPHTALTIQALVHYLYTSSLPPPSSPLCTPQILCSMLQFARPYRIDGLLEAVIERLHSVLDGRNTAAIFNATAMAAGGGDSVLFLNGSQSPQSRLNSTGLRMSSRHQSRDDESTTSGGTTTAANANISSSSSSNAARGLRINTDVEAPGGAGNPVSARTNSRRDDDEVSSASTEAASVSDLSAGAGGLAGEQEIWTGELSAVVGLQKRGLRGLMEGRRIREMGSREVMGHGGGAGSQGGGPGGPATGGNVPGSMGSIAEARIGLGIA
ncbi:hypothetical protein K402DRAFT_401278 [Aulographum hederae CBS 113979]|uniref:Galactose oxidase n=1 Tax=Aulographum hederae CBS 113979 TaxID=1176131 RepID=A0A6G1HB45_9PEZI|nr:hypothetical protein K402DRAFT_401278 [Aulographum hederae CBS 113979]